MTDTAEHIATEPELPKQDKLQRALFRFRQSKLSMLGAVMVALVVFFTAFGTLLAPFPDHIAGGVDTAARFQPPSWAHPFGTNELGQDVLSLVMAGTTVSVLAGLSVVLIGTVIGTLVGAIAGFAGGWIDEVLMRLTDLTLTIPGLILAMAVAAALGPGFTNMIIAISLSWWPGYARLVRGEVLAVREESYVNAARAIGAKPSRILLRHILPNTVSPIIVKMSLDMGFAILMVAGLGFIGIGIRPPTPEWGTLLSVSRSYMPDYWWTAMAPGMAMFFAVFGFNLLGDGLRDILDPKARR
ncbi:ABC transporter permease [Paracoccus saliphilus]|uniref:ABC transporter permease n=1 Tax=Paracoccus saliphilus TaxID=405559 RepID=A0AA46A6X7_9RHOB|nr:ABC transporter permease [Paracoccus saliphilus]WCR03785.1 ABC transporter permease [Paracoccus saliphilus]SIT04647.1 peptide/nickel transport system permease protein [Paracoccus saliphilus]